MVFFSSFIFFFRVVEGLIEAKAEMSPTFLPAKGEEAGDAGMC